jgi:arylsulfatase
VCSSDLFTRAYAPTPWTLPSHAAMFSGMHPYRLGINSLNAAIPASTPVMTPLLREAGYQTAAFVDSRPKGMVGAQRGFGRGFDVFRHAPHRAGIRSPFVYEMAATVRMARRWLRQRDPTRPFFLFLHTKAVHGVAEDHRSDSRRFPYDKPEAYRSRYLTEEQAGFVWGKPGEPGAEEHLQSLNRQFSQGSLDPAAYPPQRVEALKALYDGGVHYMDEQFGTLLRSLDEMSLSQDTVVIVTADHGEAFLEHGFFHHIEVNRQLLHVPLIIRLPRDRTGKTVDLPVELADIMPTVLQFAGLAVPGSVAAMPLPLAPSNDRPDRQIFGSYQFGSRAIYDAFSLLEGDWKLIFHKYSRDNAWLTPLLFNVAQDPDEHHPVSSQPRRAKALFSSLQSWIGGDRVGDSQIHLDQETIDHLRKLGYVD